MPATRSTAHSPRPPRDLLQQLLAYVVAVGVVDHLEVVEIEHQHGEDHVDASGLRVFTRRQAVVMQRVF